MRSKRRGILVLTIGLALLFLAGSVSSAEKVTITFETELRLEEYAREAVETLKDRFEKANPNVEIEFLDVEFSQMVPQALLKAQTGSPPDVMEGLVSWIPKLTTVLEPVKNWLEPGESHQKPEWHHHRKTCQTRPSQGRAGCPARCIQGGPEAARFAERSKRVCVCGHQPRGCGGRKAL